MTELFRKLVNQPFGQIAVGINTPVAKKGPVGARNVDRVQVDFVDEDLFFLDARFRDDLAGRVGDEALAPELDAVAADGSFVADAICHGDVAAIGHGV